MESESQSKTGWEVAAPESSYILCFVPERAKTLVFPHKHNIYQMCHFIPIKEQSEHHLLPEVDEVVSLIYEEELQRRASQVVAPQMDFSELGQRPLEIKSDS